MTVNIKEVFDGYAPLKERYQQCAEHVALILTEECQSIGLRPIVTSRAKDVASLINKCLRHGGGLEKVHDLAGVKVVVRYEREIRRIRDLIEHSVKFEASKPDDKLSVLKENQLGYLGCHYHIRLMENCPPILKDLECEVILHTGAQTLWDSISHELLYKAQVDLPKSSQRSMNRLVALMELFDSEVSAVHGAYMSTEHYQEARLLGILEKYYYRYDPHDYVKEMSYRTLSALLPKLSVQRLSTIDTDLEEFVSTHDKGLRSIYSKFQDSSDIRSVFLHQPETLLIYAMHDWGQKYDVKTAWVQLYPRDYLDELGQIFGVNFPK